ncbi:MAG: hypothetical protein JXR42_00435 [Gammaproteobacteria bacterium]|nr:hypothetical protein [Gammaproteobacteria bacterium]
MSTEKANLLTEAAMFGKMITGNPEYIKLQHNSRTDEIILSTDIQSVIIDTSKTTGRLSIDDIFGKENTDNLLTSYDLLVAQNALKVYATASGIADKNLKKLFSKNKVIVERTEEGSIKIIFKEFSKKFSLELSKKSRKNQLTNLQILRRILMFFEQEDLECLAETPNLFSVKFEEDRLTIAAHNKFGPITNLKQILQFLNAQNILETELVENSTNTVLSVVLEQAVRLLEIPLDMLKEQVELIQTANLKILETSQAVTSKLLMLEPSDVARVKDPSAALTLVRAPTLELTLTKNSAAAEPVIVASTTSDELPVESIVEEIIEFKSPYEEATEANLFNYLETEFDADSDFIKEMKNLYGEKMQDSSANEEQVVLSVMQAVMERQLNSDSQYDPALVKHVMEERYEDIITKNTDPKVVLPILIGAASVEKETFGNPYKSATRENLFYCLEDIFKTTPNILRQAISIFESYLPKEYMPIDEVISSTLQDTMVFALGEKHSNQALAERVVRSAYRSLKSQHTTPQEVYAALSKSMKKAVKLEHARKTLPQRSDENGLQGNSRRTRGTKASTKSSAGGGLFGLFASRQAVADTPQPASKSFGWW